MPGTKPRGPWFVTRGVPESLGEVPGHQPADGITRLRLLGASGPIGGVVHCAVHFVAEHDGPRPEWSYTRPQVHDFDELNILLSDHGRLRYRYEVDGAIEVVESPCAVFLPAGTTHRAEAVGGTGIFICIHLAREGDHDG